MMMNKIIIPTILVATVLIVGIFALIPVDTASTIHFTLLQAIFGSSVVLTETINDDVECCTTIDHHFILTSDKPFTIHDITVKGNLNSTLSDDWIDVRISAYPQQYGDGAGSAADADDDSRLKDVLDDEDDGSQRVLDGDDTEIPQTWSLMRADLDQSTGEAWFGPNQNVVVLVKFNPGSQDVEFNAMVTFYLRGVLGENVDVEVHEDVDENLD